MGVFGVGGGVGVTGLVDVWETKCGEWWGVVEVRKSEK